MVRQLGPPKRIAAHHRVVQQRRPDELKKAISDALAVEGPAIIDATVAANELPNMPHLDLEQIGHVAFVRVREAVLAVTGS